MGALGEERGDHHQVRKREEPIVGVAGSFRGASDETEVARASELMNMLDADASQSGNFRIGEDLLARLYRDHGSCSWTTPSLFLRLASYYLLRWNPKLGSKFRQLLLCRSCFYDAWQRVKDAIFPCNSRTVSCGIKREG